MKRRGLATVNNLPSSRWTFRFLIVAVLLTAPASWAELDHEPLARSPNLSFEEVLESALKLAPDQLAAESRQAQADRYGELGTSWYRGTPTLETSYFDDSALSSVGLREIEAGLRLQLWRPGERAEVRELGQSYQALVASWSANLALEVAGRLRNNLADLEQAEAALDLEVEATSITEELLNLTQVLFETGEVPRLDLMQAESLVLQQQQQLFDAQAALVDAEREYVILTGLNIRPQMAYREQQSTRQEIDLAHPLLRFMQANLGVARSQVNKAKRDAVASPTVGFGVRRERGGRMDEYIDSLGVSVSIPIGKSAIVDTAISDARRQEADLEVALYRSRILLEQQFHETEHRLFVTRQQLDVSASRTTLAEQRLEMARSAYELGESDLLSVTVALQEFLRARQERQELELREQRLISEYNQSLGIMP